MTTNTTAPRRFVYKASNGAFLGPFTPLLETPKLVLPYFEVVKQIQAIPGLPPSSRETVILATGSHYKAPYETYAHERVALKTTSLTKDQINQIKVGKKPEDLGRAEGVAFDAAIALCEEKGPLERELCHGCVNEFGREGALALVHYVGLYAYTCVLLNGCDVGLPEGESVMS